VLCAFALASNVAWSPSPLNNQLYHSGIWELTSNAETRTIDQMVHMVPPTAAVSATYDIVPHLSHRDQIYTWPNPWIRSYYGTSDTEPAESPRGINYLVLNISSLPQSTLVELKLLTRPGGPFHVILQSNQALLARRVRAGE
jgi:hypothetical protein